VTEKPQTLPWHIWPGHGAPCTIAEEARFVAELESSEHRPVGGSRLTFRDFLTAVVTALRCGAPPSTVLRLAPGLDPRQMLTAYREVERRRSAATAAWHAIVASPTHDSLRTHGPCAATLLPQVVLDLARRSEWMSPAQLSETVGGAGIRVLTVTEHIAGVEEQLRLSRDRARYVTQGRLLLNLYGPGLWSHPYHLPCRVGALTPLRLDDLMKKRMT
jgi:hypothetical protein